MTSSSLLLPRTVELPDLLFFSFLRVAFSEFRVGARAPEKLLLAQLRVSRSPACPHLLPS